MYSDEPKPATLGKQELAMAYFPHTANPGNARRSLHRWITMNPELVARLAEAGYQSGQHYFTPRQVAIIYEFFGEP